MVVRRPCSRSAVAHNPPQRVLQREAAVVPRPVLKEPNAHHGGAQAPDCLMPADCSRHLEDPAVAQPPHADTTVAPRLLGDPLDSRLPVSHFVEHACEPAARLKTAAAVGGNIGIAVPDKVCGVAGQVRNTVVRRSRQHDREGARPIGQVDVCGELDAVGRWIFDTDQCTHPCSFSPGGVSSFTCRMWIGGLYSSHPSCDKIHIYTSARMDRISLSPAIPTRFRSREDRDEDHRR